mmetsp:Transcript_22012/g.41448  ORF Transcript_22012/g.41448 Transcript_22012/m.41448 type:complete len:227 (+) Transcript_22012:368-1048(+)
MDGFSVQIFQARVFQCHHDDVILIHPTEILRQSPVLFNRIAPNVIGLCRKQMTSSSINHNDIQPTSIGHSADRNLLIIQEEVCNVTRVATRADHFDCRCTNWRSCFAGRRHFHRDHCCRLLDPRRHRCRPGSRCGFFDFHFRRRHRGLRIVNQLFVHRLSTRQFLPKQAHLSRQVCERFSQQSGLFSKLCPGDFWGCHATPNCKRVHMRRLLRSDKVLGQILSLVP